MEEIGVCETEVIRLAPQAMTCAAMLHAPQQSPAIDRELVAVHSFELTLIILSK